MRVYAALGMLGYGFPEASLKAAIERRPDVIAVDAGSTDPGPYYLGSGRSFTSRTMVKRDVGLLLQAARSLRVPLLVGSAGGAGAAPHLAWTLDIVREAASELDLSFRMAVISSDVSPDLVIDAIRRNRIMDFEVGRELTEYDVRRSANLVAQMGLEPLMKALGEGADVVIAGRAFDAALAATAPVMAGIDRGLALHMGKIVECGSFVALPRTSDGVIAEISSDYFTVEPADPGKVCTVELVAAHTLYEKSNPYRLLLPGGAIDLALAEFARVDDRTVKVSGSRYVPADRYMVKLEGSAFVGYRAVCLAAARDPFMIREIDAVTARVRRKIEDNLAHVAEADAYSLRFRVYGRNGVMGELEPNPNFVPQEITIVVEAIANSQDLADTVCALGRSALLHQGYEGRIATSGNVAFPYSPADFAAPPAYEFSVYHLMECDDPLELFPIRWESVGT
jgi:hypothetical protein